MGEYGGAADGPEIVVGIDGSETSRAALDWAADAAQRRGMRLAAVHALSMPEVAMPFAAAVRINPSQEITDRVSVLLTAAAERVAERHPGVRMRSEYSLQDPAPALIGAAEGAAMAVVGSRGLGGVGSLFLGSVGDRVAAHAAVPVVVVPPGAAFDTPRAGRITVGVDGSEHAAAALRFALAEAAASGAAVAAVYAWQLPVPFTVPPVAADEPAFDRDAFAAAALERAQAAVDGARTAATESVPVEISVVEDQAANALLQASRGTDLLVVGSRGRGGFTGLLLGSVGRSLLHHAQIPVAIAR
ncbi:universal stress protein [Nocardiopsis coralliicola]